MEYITDFVCTYHLIEDLDYSDMLYKTQLMQAFIQDISNSEINIDTDDDRSRHGRVGDGLLVAVA